MNENITMKEMGKETGIYLPEFAIKWLMLESKKSKSKLEVMPLKDIFNMDKAGHQALMEYSIELTRTPHSKEIKEFIKNQNLTHPVVEKVILSDSAS